MKTCIFQSRQMIFLVGFAILIMLTCYTPPLVADPGDSGITYGSVAGSQGPHTGRPAHGTGYSSDQKSLNFVFGFGLVISPDYNDVLKKAYPRHEVSGGWGWGDIHAGLRINLTEQLSVIPGIDFWFNFGTGDITFANLIFLPSLSMRCALWPEPALYLRGELNYAIPNIGADFPADSKGMGYGGAIGYAFDGGVSLEAGYLYVPIEVGRSTENFGGFQIKFTIAI